MTPATTVDRSEFRHILFSGTVVGLVTAAAVIAFLVVSRLLPAGIVPALLGTLIVLAGGEHDQRTEERRDDAGRQEPRYHQECDDSRGGHQPDDGPTEEDVAELGAIDCRRRGHALLERGC